MEDKQTAINNVKSLVRLNAQTHPDEIATMLPYLIQLTDMELDYLMDCLYDKHFIDKGSLITAILNKIEVINDIDAIKAANKQVLEIMDYSGWVEQIFLYEQIDGVEGFQIKILDVSNADILDALKW